MAKVAKFKVGGWVKHVADGPPMYVLTAPLTGLPLEYECCWFDLAGGYHWQKFHESLLEPSDPPSKRER